MEAACWQALRGMSASKLAAYEWYSTLWDHLSETTLGASAKGRIQRTGKPLLPPIAAIVSIAFGPVMFTHVRPQFSP